MFKRLYFLTMFLAIILLFSVNAPLFYFFKNVYFLKNIALCLFFLYAISNMFFYFSTFYQFSKYTSFVKFFWQRSFVLFWLIEFYLFIVFLYLYFFCPDETRYFFDYISQSKPQTYSFEELFKNLLYLVIFFFLLDASSVCLRFGNRKKLTLITFFSTIIFLFIFTKESLLFKNSLNHLNSFFFRNNLFFSRNNSLEKVDFFINYNKCTYTQRPTNSLFFFLFLVKFVHFVLILILFFFFLTKLLKGSLTNESVSLLKINTNYLLLFYIINYFLFFKPLLQINCLSGYFFNFSFDNLYLPYYIIQELILNLL